ncbi:hypothetical protein [Acidihalobacter aeolianus]|nr:hypothetical protein [Acidihalobacter aeolianus]
MSTNASFIVVVTVALVLMAAILYFVPKYNRWVDRHNSKRK